MLDPAQGEFEFRMKFADMTRGVRDSTSSTYPTQNAVISARNRNLDVVLGRCSDTLIAACGISKDIPERSDGEQSRQEVLKSKILKTITNALKNGERCGQLLII